MTFLKKPILLLIKEIIVDNKEEFVFGRNAVLEAIKSDSHINRIMIIKDQGGSLGQIRALAREKAIVFTETSKEKLDELTGGKHQGVLAYLAARDYSSLEDIIGYARERHEDPFIVVLDEIQDPHNLGAIIRSCDATGVHGIIIAKRRQVPLTATVAKTSAGAIEHVRIARVTNIGQTLDQLKEEGLWIYGTDSDGTSNFFSSNLKGPIALVIGNEGFGMGPLVRKKCDFILNIPMVGKISSLNAFLP